MSVLDLPRWTGGESDARDNLQFIERWATSEPMRRLVVEFGGSLPSRDAGDVLADLDAFSAEHWDFRGGRERNLAETVFFAAERDQVILGCSAELGLAHSDPRHPQYDTVLMTGGMVRAGITKPRYVRSLLDGGLRVKNVVFLGGFRPFAGDEHEVARALAIEGGDEFDGMVAGLERAFGPLGEPHVREQLADSPGGSWRVCSWQAPGVQVSAVAAPSSAPLERRANTVDTYRFWAEECRASDESSVLVVTAPVYVPYQGAGAVETLGLEYGLEVETVGSSPEAGDLGELTQEFAARHHLQELRAAIRGMRSLRERLLTRADENL